MKFYSHKWKTNHSPVRSFKATNKYCKRVYICTCEEPPAARGIKMKFASLLMLSRTILNSYAGRVHVKREYLIGIHSYRLTSVWNLSNHQTVWQKCKVRSCWMLFNNNFCKFDALFDVSLMMSWKNWDWVLTKCWVGYVWSIPSKEQYYGLTVDNYLFISYCLIILLIQCLFDIIKHLSNWRRPLQTAGYIIELKWFLQIWSSSSKSM